MNRIVICLILVSLLAGCMSIHKTAQVDDVRLGMTKQELLIALKHGNENVKASSSKKLDNGSLEECIQLEEKDKKYTFVFVDGALKEWFTVDAPKVTSTTTDVPYTSPTGGEPE